MNTYFVQMESPEELVPARPVKNLHLREVNPPDGRVNHRFYHEVGGPWGWTYCAEWSAEEWTSYVEANSIFTVVLDWGREEIGYGELISRSGEVEILSFGLLPPFVGRGLGSASLEVVTRFAWNLPGARRVWLHTCDMDHPNALNNYQRRGFVLFDTKTDDEWADQSRA